MEALQITVLCWNGNLAFGYDLKLSLLVTDDFVTLLDLKGTVLCVHAETPGENQGAGGLLNNNGNGI